jgi:hypothetical protein
VTWLTAELSIAAEVHHLPRAVTLPNETPRLEHAAPLVISAPFV